MSRALFSFVALASLFLSPVVSADTLIADFEGDSYGQWQMEGDAFGEAPARGTLPNQMEVSGYRGRGLVNSYLKKDASTGSLTSPPITIDEPFLVFLVGGGNLPGEVGVELLIDGKAVRTATGTDSETLTWHSWNVTEFQGKSAKLRIYDNATGGWGHINVDQILLTETPRTGTGILRLEEYRKSAEYYREMYRPQFHFTPEINWMNDPNGMVFFDGEYHLFYQHNPHGNEWGHMSWGHAVSRDLIHWEHLPIALHDEYGTMIFSGSCVVDWKNTSGFGDGTTPPMIAIYTGHGHGKQTQDIAYSLDKGRTWTKYAGNPVLDRNEADFRDPKVFWHKSTGKWIMVVSLATQKRVQFYGSKDLKTWAHLSDFGPAGAKAAANWECPDLFELPIEGEPGKTHWVLEVDMGNGSIAGGSGGQYFFGEFDGKTFQPDEPLDTVRWVDYGRDFYAAVSWADVPESDGRRLWLGWMSNWQTALLPTFPWRSAMSIPRELTLRRVDGKLLLIQRPVKELQKLRQDPVEHRDVRIDAGEIDFAQRGFEFDQLEVIAEIEPKSSSSTGFIIANGAGDRTVIRYDAESKSLAIDRTQSGNVTFDDRFPGIHSAPVTLQDGRLKLHLLVDRSSVELFVNDGAVVFTERIFPSPGGFRLKAFVEGGAAEIPSLKAWPLKSIWKKN